MLKRGHDVAGQRQKLPISKITDVSHRLIWLLSSSKSTAVHAVVDTWVYPGVHILDLVLQVLRVQVEIRVLSKGVEL